MRKERTFEEVVKSIEMSEKDVDRILKAARLNMVEKHKMSDDRFETLCGLVMVLMAVLVVIIPIIFG